MKRYKQLTIEQRYQICGLTKAGFDQSAIAVELKVDKGTISREQACWRGFVAASTLSEASPETLCKRPGTQGHAQEPSEY